MPCQLEICADGLAAVMAAHAGGADAIELCSALPLGGLTPSMGVLQAALSVTNIPIRVLIRPRAGDFTYRTDEIGVVERDITIAKDAGAAGIVIGCLTASQHLDVATLRRWAALAAPLTVTFHRAFDSIHQPLSALEKLAEAGCHYVLTSGQAPTALAGKAVLATLLQHIEKEALPIQLIAASGIVPATLPALVNLSNLTWVHSSARAQGKLVLPTTATGALEAAVAQFGDTDASVVKALKAILEAV